MNPENKLISVNGRDYRWPDKPCVVVCIDGSEPDYIEMAIAAGVMPWIKKVVEEQGVDLRAHLFQQYWMYTDKLLRYRYKIIDAQSNKLMNVQTK